MATEETRTLSELIADADAAGREVPAWVRRVAALQRVRFGHVSQDRQRALWLSARAREALESPAVTLSSTQEWWLDRLEHKWRMQLRKITSGV